MRKMPSLGEQELELLKFVSEHTPISVREVAEKFNKSLARTTVLTVMERLRKKGFLVRSQIDGIYKYSAKIHTGEVVNNKVSEFIEKTLGGSLSPLIAYFQSASKLTEQEIAQLKEMAAKLEAKR